MSFGTDPNYTIIYAPPLNFVQVTGSVSTSNISSVTLPLSVTKGNTIVVIASPNPDSGGVNSVTDGFGTVYKQRFSDFNSFLFIWTGVVSGSGILNLIVNWNSGTSKTVIAAEYSGVQGIGKSGSLIVPSGGGTGSVTLSPTIQNSLFVAGANVELGTITNAITGNLRFKKNSLSGIASNALLDTSTNPIGFNFGGVLVDGGAIELLPFPTVIIYNTGSHLTGYFSYPDFSFYDFQTDIPTLFRTDFQRSFADMQAGHLGSVPNWIFEQRFKLNVTGSSNSISHRTDTKLFGSPIINHLIDALKYKRTVLINFTDAGLKATTTKQHFSDALNKAIQTKTFTSDSGLKATKTLTYFTDARLGTFPVSKYDIAGSKYDTVGVIYDGSVSGISGGFLYDVGQNYDSGITYI